MVLSVASYGRTFAIILFSLPTSNEKSLSSKLSSVTSTLGLLTIRFKVAHFPFVEVALIETLPSLIAFTTPVFDTVATEVSELFHVIDLSFAESGVTVAIIVSSSLISIFALGAFNVIFQLQPFYL